MEISKEEYCKLLRSFETLEALEAGGVDNWEGYELALSDLNQKRLEERELKKLSEEIVERLEYLIYEPSERGSGFSFRDDPTETVLDLLKKYNVRLETD